MFNKIQNSMRHHISILASVVILSLLVILPSCSDDEPPAKAQISFAESTITVNEADGVIEIEIVLDKPAKEDLNIEYEIDGSAQDFETSTQNSPGDYEILQDLSDYGEVDITKGETTGIIEIELFSDFDLEDNETIELTLTSVNSTKAELAVDAVLEITVEQEDGLLIVLSWNYPDVDMDLFLWSETSGGDLGLTNVNSAGIGFDGPEGFFLPTALLDNGTYGLSCNYYEGTANPMNFEVDFIEIVNGNETTTTRNGSYDLNNINKWDDNSSEDFGLILVQTFDKSGADFTNYSQITKPTSGSRVSTQLPDGVKLTKGDRIKPRSLRK